jgi:hypothetical protein
LLFTFWVLSHRFSKIKSYKEVTKQKESSFFLLFLLDDRRSRIQEAKKYTDPDPQHWLYHQPFIVSRIFLDFLTFRWARVQILVASAGPLEPALHISDHILDTVIYGTHTPCHFYIFLVYGSSHREDRPPPGLSDTGASAVFLLLCDIWYWGTTPLPPPSPLAPSCYLSSCHDALVLYNAWVAVSSVMRSMPHGFL